MSDVYLYNTHDGGEVQIVNGVVTLDGGIESSVYLSLFGGNEDDAGGQDTTQTWWGNIGEEAARQYRSRTQNLLQSIPPTSFNLKRLEDAVLADLNWLITSGVATSVNVNVSIPALNTVNITVNVAAVGTFEYLENWRASS